MGTVIVGLAGCGGGGGTGGDSASTGPSQTAIIGQGAVTYKGTPKPRITASSGSVTVSGLAGANITAVNVSPAPALNNTYFAYSRFINNTNQIYTLPYAGGTEQLVTRVVGGANAPAVSKTGYISYTQASNLHGGLVRADGSSNKQLSFTGGPTEFINSSISPYANYVAFDDGNNKLWYSLLSGGAATFITGDADLGISFESNNSTLAYTALNNSGYYNVYTIPITGGASTDVTPFALQLGGQTIQPSCSNDGTTIAATFETSGSSQIVVFATNSADYNIVTPSGFNDTSPSFSPDGTKIAFYRGSTGGATAGIYVCDYSGDNLHLVYADPAPSETVSDLAWSPFPYTQLLLGTNANLYNGNVDGFLLSQNGQQFGGVLGFTTTTASTASITASSITSSAPLVFTISGDNVTMIEYTNSFFNLHGETLIQPTGTNPNALVTVDPYTGGIDTVGVAATAILQPSSKVTGGNLTYTAKFTGIYDKNGKNIAPSGAKQMVVNSTTGKLISFQ